MKTDSERADLYYRLYRKEVLAHEETRGKNIKARFTLLMELDDRQRRIDEMELMFAAHLRGKAIPTPPLEEDLPVV